jgi:hypothetical protein
MFSNVLVPEQSMDRHVKCVMQLASCSVAATRNFFLFSKHILQFADAVQLMQSLLVHLENTHTGDMLCSAQGTRQEMCVHVIDN